MKKDTHDLPAMARAVTEKTRLVFIANPNNPTGTRVTAKGVDRFLRSLPDDVITVFDEAYFEYTSPRGRPDTLEYIRQEEAVITLRTFSKAYGLAGLRIGYLFAPPKYVEAMNKVRQPFNTNSLAQTAAVAALEDERHLRRVVRLNRRERRALEQALREIDLHCLPSQGNFLLVDVGRSGSEVYGELLTRGVITRAMAGYGYPNHLRVTVGTPEENNALLEALKSVLGR
jgi:histidinol-phosphate aminotransferase